MQNSLLTKSAASAGDFYLGSARVWTHAEQGIKSHSSHQLYRWESSAEQSSRGL